MFAAVVCRTFGSLSTITIVLFPFVFFIVSVEIAVDSLEIVDSSSGLVHFSSSFGIRKLSLAGRSRTKALPTNKC